MRVRFIGLSAAVMLLLSTIGLIATAGAAPLAATTATVAATTKAVHTPTSVATKAAATATATATTAPPTETATTAPTATSAGVGADSTASPVAETATTVAVVTLVMWYEQTPNAGPLKLLPIQINENGVAGPGDAAKSKVSGSVDFEDPKNNGLPRIVLGDSNFDGYAVTPDDPNSVLRWTYFNDDSGLRPSTLVVQVKATSGPYKDYDGSATFISRAPKAGGVLVISLNPPSS